MTALESGNRYALATLAVVVERAEELRDIRDEEMVVRIVKAIGG